MAKGKTTGLRKSHGPKTKRFCSYSKAVRYIMAKTGLLNKHTDSEAFYQSQVGKSAGKPDKFMGMRF